MAREVPQLIHWMTATDAAKALGLTRQTINKMIQTGELKTAHRLGSRLYVVKRSEVNARIKSQEPAPEVNGVEHPADGTLSDISLPADEEWPHEPQLPAHDA